jgi:multiple sugar transport system substrate-binding protein
MYRSKNILIVSLLFFSAILITSCNSCNNQKKIELNIIGEALPPLQSLGALAKEYEAKTGVKIIVHPYEFETALQKSQLDFLSGKGEYDVVMGIFYNHGRYFENGYIKDLTPYINDTKYKDITVPIDNFYPALQDIDMKYKGKVIGYPFSAQTMFLWYRKDLFENLIERENFKKKYGYDLPVPDENNLLNWNQYQNIVEFFTRKKGEKLAGENLNNDFFGTTLQLKRHPCSIYEFTNYVYSFGGRFYNENNKPVANSKENVEALNYYLSLKKYSPSGVLQYTWDDALAQMQQGLIATTIMWSDAPSALYDSTQSKVVGKIGYSLVPTKVGVDKKVSVFGGWAFLINDKSKYPDEAYKFIQWACSPEMQLRWAKKGGLPASKNIFEDKEYLEIPYMKTQNEALKNLVAWQRTPNTEEFVSKGILALSKAATGEMTAQQSLDWLQTELTKTK